MALPSPRRVDRARLRPWVLLLLRARPRHAYDLVAEFGRLGLPPPDRPTLYRLLHDLEAARLLSSSWQPNPAGPDRRIYRVTAGGTRQLRRDVEDLAALGDDLRLFDREWSRLDGRLRRSRTRPSSGEPPIGSPPGSSRAGS